MQKKNPALQKEARQITDLVRSALGQDLWDLRTVRIDSSLFLLLQSKLALWLDALIKALATVNVRPSRLHLLDERLLRATRLLETLPLNQHPDLTEIARKCGLSVVQLNRLFRRHLGMTMHACFERIRGENAIRCIVAGARPKQIAHELGFVSLAHFSRWFRRQAGVSPRQCSNQHSI
jgi:AraC family transcriptional activator of pobA